MDATSRGPETPNRGRGEPTPQRRGTRILGMIAENPTIARAGRVGSDRANQVSGAARRPKRPESRRWSSAAP